MFAHITPLAGTPAFNDFSVADTTQREPLGTIVTAVDNFWGTGTFIYLKSNATVIKGSLVMWDELYQAALLPSTAGQGFPFAVAMTPAASGTYFWAQVQGFAVLKSTSDVAADAAAAVAGAGLAGALAAGKQLLNVRVRKANAATKTVNATTQAGNGILYCPNGYDGIFLGMALSGTGIPASTVAAGLDPDGKRIYTGSAIGTLGDKNSTASGSITLTGTFTGYLGAVINFPHAQGQIL
jgi:hypothetical protein